MDGKSAGPKLIVPNASSSSLHWFLSLLREVSWKFHWIPPERRSQQMMLGTVRPTSIPQPGMPFEFDLDEP